MRKRSRIRWGRVGAAFIKYLLSASADQSIKDKAGLTPLELARSRRSSCLGDVLNVLRSAQTQEDLKPAVLHLKPQHLDESSPIKLPTLDTEKCTFVVGLLRRRAAEMSGVEDNQRIRLFYNDGNSNTELCDDTKACKDEGLIHNSELWEVREEGDSAANAFDESLNFPANAVDGDAHASPDGMFKDEQNELR